MTVVSRFGIDRTTACGRPENRYNRHHQPSRDFYASMIVRYDDLVLDGGVARLSGRSLVDENGTKIAGQ